MSTVSCGQSAECVPLIHFRHLATLCSCDTLVQTWHPVQAQIIKCFKHLDGVASVRDAKAPCPAKVARGQLSSCPLVAEPQLMQASPLPCCKALHATSQPQA
jgi:hypothetical protein